MPVERHKVGRSYTRREYAEADMADPEAVLTLMEETTASDPTVEGRIADAERRAVAHLQRAGMPVDPRQPPYGDPAWLRDNERTSTIWYAITVVNTVRILRNHIERGDIRAAVDVALELGVLMTEVKTIGWYAGFTSRGGQGFAISDKVCLDVAGEHEALRAQAKYLWTENPRRTQKAVAKKIAPGHPKKHRNIIRVISDLDPRKQK